MTILDGKAYSKELRVEVRQMAEAFYNKYGRQIGLAVVIIGEDPASQIYVRNKINATEESFIKSFSLRLPESVSQEEAENEVKKLALNDEVDGIIVQLPLPKKFDSNKILAHIPPEKDVDGLCSQNLGKLFMGEKTLISCTPYGIIKLLKKYGIDFAGKNAVVIGRSNIVGKPMALLLLRENGTVTITHSKTQNLKEVCKRADILVVAIGRPKMIDASYVKEGAVVIDVGIHRNEKNKLCGDVDFESVEPIASAITPVPGGVGPMTIAMLMNNCVEAATMFE